jgi:ketosteroid isomerase-like protein
MVANERFAISPLYAVLQSQAAYSGTRLLTGTWKMVSYSKFGAVLIFAGLLLTACTIDTDTETEVQSAKTAVDDFWRAIGTQDLDLLSRVVAQDEELIVFGTDAAERWVGSTAFLSAEEQIMQAFDVLSLDRREETLQVHSRGGVAWFSTVFDIAITVDGEVAGLKGLRTTGVVEKRNDDWVIVQLHTSVPVAGQEVEY